MTNIVEKITAKTLFYCDLRGRNYAGADLSNADLQGADLRGANLNGANLSGANLNKANLSGADLRGAILDNSNINYCKFLGCNMDEQTSFAGANLNKAKHLNK